MATHLVGGFRATVVSTVGAVVSGRLTGGTPVTLGAFRWLHGTPPASRRLLTGLLTVLCTLVIAPAVRAQVSDAAETSVEAVLRGIEARGAGCAFAGRALIARLFSVSHYEEYAGRGSVYVPPQEDTAGLPEGRSEGELGVSMADFAYGESRLRWRREVREIVLSGLLWEDYGAQLPSTGPTTRARELYRSSVSDGDVVRSYNRSNRRAVISPLDSSEAAIDTPRFAGVFLLTVPSWLAPFYRNEDLVDAMVMGIDVLDGLECYVIATSSHPDEVGTRGFTRVWVAPERDFGVLRFEYIREDPDGRAGLCRVDRSSSWAQAQPSGLWVPMVVQSDNFDYGAGSTPSWEYSTLYVVQDLTVAN